MYEEFAKNYDEMMGEIPYETWFFLVRECLKKYGVVSGSLCELGCGTGTLTEMFFQAGYEIIGVDYSEEMLAVARQKNPEIFYVQQDMTELSLLTNVDAMISLCDTMNYLTRPQEMLLVFQRVKKYLKPGGIFLFDLKTEFCYKNKIGDQTMVDEGDDYISIWENTYFDEEKINQYSLILFQREPGSELYRRAEEVHHQRVYAMGEIKELLAQSGMELAAWYGEDMQPAKEDTTGRLYVVARKPKEEGAE